MYVPVKGNSLSSYLYLHGLMHFIITSQTCLSSQHFSEINNYGFLLLFLASSSFLGQYLVSPLRCSPCSSPTTTALVIHHHIPCHFSLPVLSPHSALLYASAIRSACKFCLFPHLLFAFCLSETVWYLSFSFWLTLLCVIPLSSIHGTSVILMAEQYFSLREWERDLLDLLTCFGTFGSFPCPSCCK